MKKLLLSTLAMFIMTDSIAQVIPLGVVPGDWSGWSNRLVRSLSEAGQKILGMEQGGFTLYNLDMTTYLTVQYPEPPVGYHWFEHYAWYCSQDLFDADLSSIEYLMHAYHNEDGHPATAILRTNGDLVFWVEHEQPSGSNGLDATTQSPWIFNTSEYAIMQLEVDDGSMDMHYYRLRGKLPCVDCDGNITPELVLTNDTPPQYPAPGVSRIFPNPASSGTEVIFGLESGVEVKTLLLMDQAGKLVERLPVPHGADRLSVGLSGIRTGVYSYALETDKGMVQGSRLVVVR